MQSRVRPENIGIISPYGAQVKLIQRSLPYNAQMSVQVSTVDAFQGWWDVLDEGDKNCFREWTCTKQSLPKSSRRSALYLLPSRAFPDLKRCVLLSGSGTSQPGISGQVASGKSLSLVSWAWPVFLFCGAWWKSKGSRDVKSLRQLEQKLRKAKEAIEKSKNMFETTYI